MANGNNSSGALVPTASGTTGWSLETLYVHFTALLSDAKGVTHQRITEHEKASLYAIDATEKKTIQQLEDLEKQLAAKIEGHNRLDEMAVVTLRTQVDQHFASNEKAFDVALESINHNNDQRFIDQEKAVHAALAAAEKAVDRAEINAEKWRQNANEWRAAMDDREVKFMPREESIAGLHGNAEKIAALTDRMNRGEGKGAGLDASWGYLLGFVVLVGAIISIFLAFHK